MLDTLVKLIAFCKHSLSTQIVYERAINSFAKSTASIGHAKVDIQ